MGGSDGEGGIGVDSAVGTIVWVRRRNGSWWPGRILGSEELSASHLMSPRSGTPVKLLGREDASVDWYNLEKSKRVKAFRCGEFDSCIERAAASQGIPIKKREKYARREDAILHALELEKQQLEMKHQNFRRVVNGIKNRNSSAQRREMNRFSSDIHMRDDELGVHSKLTNKKSHNFSKKAVSSCKEEEHPENISQVGGLQDFGLRIASSKRKLSQPVIWEASRRSLNVNMDVLSNIRHMAGNESHTGSSRSSLATKRKKSHGNHGEDYVSKKRDRRRPLAQVFQSSSNLPVSHSFQSDYDTGGISIQGERDHMGAAYHAKKSRYVYPPADSNDSLDNNRYPYDEMTSPSTQFGTENSVPLTEGYSPSSELAEETESDSSETDYLEADTEEDGNIMTDTDQEEAPGFEDYNPPFARVSENYRDPNNDDIPLPGYIPTVHLQDHLDASADAGVSKWNLKGKRNIRNLAKRPVEKIFNDNMTQMVSSSQRSARLGFYHENDIFENELGHSQLLGYGQRRYPFPSHGFNDSDVDSPLLSPPSHTGRRAYWEESDERFNLDYAGCYGDESESMLVDVNIKVQNPSHQGEHVPFVSLMSRFNGKQIIGHPVQIEILEDGSYVDLVSKFDAGLDRSSAPPSFGRTAKRSTMHRLPRSNPSASALEDDDHDLFDSDQEIRTPVGYINHQVRFPRKNIANPRRPKLLQSVNSLSSQKTRTLSSFATEQSRGLKLHRRSSIIDGLIKPDGGIPLVTCVPVKVVFSRILESIGRPSSISAHRVRGPS